MPPSNGLTRRRLMTALAVLPGALAFKATGDAFAQSAAASRADTAASVDPQVISDLVAANHILVRKGIILIQGHISVRHDRNPNRYFLARGIAPETVATADIMEFEQVAVVDVDNGARFETYTIAGEPGSGDMKVNGAAARLVHRGDTIIVISYAAYDPDELANYNPRVVHVGAHNEIHSIDREVATLLATPTPA